MLKVFRDAYDAMVDHAIEGDPEEVCGVLGGTYGETTSTVRAVERAANAAPVPEYEYAIDPTEQYAIMNDLKERGLDVVGFYHSHPTGPAGPSATDAKHATWPGRSYVIVDVTGNHPFVGAWRWDADGERFVREVLDVG